MEFVEFNIEGMNCDHCEKIIEKQFVGKKGIQDIEISYSARSGKFTFNSRIISEKEIIKIINETEQYSVVEETKDEFSSNINFDLILVGGGAAAFSAAIKAEELGVKTLMVNAGMKFGGACVNVGCVPSKNLVRAAEAADHASHSNFLGIKPKGVDIDYAQVIRDKKKLVKNMQQSKYMDVVKDFKHLTMIKGRAKFVNEHSVIVNDKTTYTAQKIIVSTGSTVNILNIEGLNEIDFLTNINLFNIEEKPKSITILGAGYIGLEIAMAYNRLGIKVQIIEFSERLMQSQSSDIADVIEKQLIKEGINLLINYKVQKFEKKGSETIIYCKCADGSIAQIIEKGKIVVATGAKPNSSNLGLEIIGIQQDERGHIKVNNKMETNISHIYAVGDVADTPSFVYTAAHEGKIAVENAFTKSEKNIDYSALPWLVFTDPQIAGVGVDEQQAAEQKIPFEVSKIELKHVPRSIVAQDTRGFIKLIRNSDSDKLIGARIVAPEGGELIQMLSMSIKHGITIKELAEEIYPYLTLGEGIKLAAITFGKDVSKLSCCAS